MRVCCFAPLHAAALAVMATESSETSHSIVHLVPLRDGADHREDALINRALRAQAVFDDDEERIPDIFFLATKNLANTIDSHQSIPDVQTKMEEAAKTWETLSKKKGMVSNLGKHFSGMSRSVWDSYDEALATKLVAVYSDRGVARAIRLTRASDPSSREAKRLSRLQDMVIALWIERRHTAHEVLSHFDTRNDADFFASTTFTFLEKFVRPEGNANAAIFEYFEKNFSRFFSAVARAKELSVGDEILLDDSESWMLQYCVDLTGDPTAFEHSLEYFQEGMYSPIDGRNNFEKLSTSQIEELTEKFRDMLRNKERNLA